MGTTLTLNDALAAFFQIRGVDLLGRTGGFYRWYSNGPGRLSRTHESVMERRDGPRDRLAEPGGRTGDYLDFTSRDHLGLNAHPRVSAAIGRSLRDLGPQSATPGLWFGTEGNLPALVRELGDYLERAGVVLCLPGQDMARGALQDLLRAGDHLLLDSLAGPALEAAARAASARVAAFNHASVPAAEERSREIRTADSTNAIVVAVESSCAGGGRAEPARVRPIVLGVLGGLVVDVSNDLGASGPGGLGALVEQGTRPPRSDSRIVVAGPVLGRRIPGRRESGRGAICPVFWRLGSRRHRTCAIRGRPCGVRSGTGSGRCPAADHAARGVVPTAEGTRRQGTRRPR